VDALPILDAIERLIGERLDRFRERELQLKRIPLAVREPGKPVHVMLSLTCAQREALEKIFKKTCAAPNHRDADWVQGFSFDATSVQTQEDGVRVEARG
jgi:hypothetical protein